MDAEIWEAFHMCDSLFPGGTLAQSQGLESALLNNYIKFKDLSQFIEFCTMVLEQVAQHLFIPFVHTVWHEIKDRNLDSFSQFYAFIDNCCHAMLTNEVTRFASISQGKGFLRVIRECYSHKVAPQVLDTLDRSHGHHAPLFACVCSLLGISLQLCERMYFRILLRDLTSAAVRLNVIGPLEASKIQVEIAPKIESILSLKRERASEVEIDMIANAFNGLHFYDNIIPRQTAPIIDLLQAQHGLLYSRLFSS